MGKHKLLVIIGVVGSYLLHFPFRLLEDWVMGEIGEMIAENWQSYLGFFITWVLPFIIVFGAIWLGYHLRSSKNGLKTKAVVTRKDTDNGFTLVDTLAEMHERMMHFKDIRLRQRFDKKRFEDACPLFFDRLGIVKASDWSTFERRVAKRVKHHVPKSPEKKAGIVWIYKVIGEAKEIVKELVSSKDWQIDDLVKAGGHLDSIHMGLGELRDNDEQWQDLFKVVKPYTTDSILRGLIDKHVSHSYAFCSTLLAISYGNRLPKHEFGRMLCSALTSSNISPDKIEIALGEILEQVEHRLEEIRSDNSELKASTPCIKIVDIYEDNKRECGLICRNTTLTNLTNCQARLIDLAFEVPHPRYSMERYSKAEDLICPQSIGGSSNGKIPLFRWGLSGGSKDLEIVYKSKTEKIGYGILNAPILVLINVWADNLQNTYAVCKLGDRLGWGYELSVLETGILKGEVKLATYQKPNPDIEGSQT